MSQNDLSCENSHHHITDNPNLAKHTSNVYLHDDILFCDTLFYGDNASYGSHKMLRLFHHDTDKSLFVLRLSSSGRDVATVSCVNDLDRTTLVIITGKNEAQSSLLRTNLSCTIKVDSQVHSAAAFLAKELVKLVKEHLTPSKTPSSMSSIRSDEPSLDMFNPQPYAGVIGEVMHLNATCPSAMGMTSASIDHGSTWTNRCLYSICAISIMFVCPCLTFPTTSLKGGFFNTKHFTNTDADPHNTIAAMSMIPRPQLAFIPRMNITTTHISRRQTSRRS